MKKVGQNIRSLRHIKGWSQEDVSKRLGISVPAFSKIETSVTDVNLSRLQQIAAVFEISVVQLITLNEPGTVSDTNELETANQKLIKRESEVIGLQKKVIELFEELRTVKITA